MWNPINLLNKFLKSFYLFINKVFWLASGWKAVWIGLPFSVVKSAAHLKLMGEWRGWIFEQTLETIARGLNKALLLCSTILQRVLQDSSTKLAFLDPKKHKISILKEQSSTHRASILTWSLNIKETTDYSNGLRLRKC